MRTMSYVELKRICAQAFPGGHGTASGQDTNDVSIIGRQDLAILYQIIGNYVVMDSGSIIYIVFFLQLYHVGCKELSPTSHVKVTLY
mgnify:CR=1 FL=1